MLPEVGFFRKICDLVSTSHFLALFLARPLVSRFRPRQQRPQQCSSKHQTNLQQTQVHVAIFSRQYLFALSSFAGLFFVKETQAFTGLPE